jgi:hypothetical protein
VIVRYPYDPGTFSIFLTSPANSQVFSLTAAVSATATFGNGMPPYTVKFYLDGSGTPASTTPNATSPLTVDLGVLSVGSHTVEARVTDNTSTTVSSETNTFTVFNLGNTGSGGTITYTDAGGLNPVASPPYAGGYVIHTFTNSGTLNIPVPASADVLVVAGGGGGGGSASGSLGSGGGGAGGYLFTSTFSITGGSNYTVTVGTGGAPGSGKGVQGTNGGDSVFGSLTAIGGGGGGGGTAIRVALVVVADLAGLPAVGQAAPEPAVRVTLGEQGRTYKHHLTPVAAVVEPQRMVPLLRQTSLEKVGMEPAPLSAG